MQLGIEVERVGAPDDPLEGSNVTLICSSSVISSSYDVVDPPTWFYYANGNATWHKFSNNFLKEPNAGILTLYYNKPTIRKLTLILTLLLFENLTYRRRYSKRN
jgi:hypothetical protein